MWRDKTSWLWTEKCANWIKVDIISSRCDSQMWGCGVCECALRGNNLRPHTHSLYRHDCCNHWWRAGWCIVFETSNIKTFLTIIAASHSLWAASLHDPSKANQKHACRTGQVTKESIWPSSFDLRHFQQTHLELCPCCGSCRLPWEVLGI